MEQCQLTTAKDLMPIIFFIFKTVEINQDEFFSAKLLIAWWNIVKRFLPWNVDISKTNFWAPIWCIITIAELPI